MSKPAAGTRGSTGRRWRPWRLAASSAALLAGAALATPALGAGSPPPPPPVCPPGGGSSSTQQIAGYTLSALGAGFHYEVDSKGLLPVGDPQKGQVMEFDVPFARTTVSAGPLIDSVASAAYPGDVAAHLGSALGTFGFPFPVPNDPVLAESTYPAAPGRSADEQFSPPAGGVAVGSAHTTAQATQSSADSTVNSSVIGAAGGPPLVSGGSAVAHSAAHLDASCVDSMASSVTGPIDIAGLIHVDGVTASATSRSDGATGVPRAELTIGKVTVAGQQAYIDRNGVHLAGSPPVGSGVVPQTQASLQQALQAAGLGVKLIDPVVTTKGGAATADSGGLAITIDRQLPATGVPGVPALSLPGLPPVPLGTPGEPLHAELIFGAARVTANATTAPAFGALDSGALGGLPPQSAGTTGTDIGIPATSGAFLASGTSSLGQGPERLVATSSGVPARGSPIPAGWVIIGVLASVVAAGPMFSYARWQLLEGRV